jgi:hypothetical protein
MPTFLSDPSPTLYLVLAAVGVVAGVVWINRRTRKSLAVFLGVVAVVGVVFLIDAVFESPREEAVRRAQAIVKAADTRDTEAFVSHLADTLTYQGDNATLTLTREQLRRANFWSVLHQFNVHVAAWDFSREDVKTIDGNTIEIGFLAKGEAEGKQIPMYFRATFRKQPDGQMKLSGLASFDPVNRTERKDLSGYLK